MSHSPAPFFIESFRLIKDANGLTVATVVYEDDEKCERANANLFAAAPELLAACEYALAVFKDVDLGDCNQADGDARRMLFNAIAKAKGG